MSIKYISFIGLVVVKLLKEIWAIYSLQKAKILFDLFYFCSKI